MRTISQRELRNDNAQIIRDVEMGESFTVTKNRIPVAQVTPVNQGDSGTMRGSLRIVKPATRSIAELDLPSHRSVESSSVILDYLRQDRIR